VGAYPFIIVYSRVISLLQFRSEAKPGFFKSVDTQKRDSGILKPF
jgi:hypothetical protein